MNIIEFLTATLRPEDVVFEIGANQGDCLAVEASIASYVMAFEANAELASVLRFRYITTKNVCIRQEAISDKIGHATFYIDQRPGVGAVASSLLVLNDLTDTLPVEVPTTTIDSVVADTGMVPTFIKIDTEGAEPMVLAGARKTIETHRPRIVFELWETHWPRYQEAVSWLAPLYTLTRIQDGSEAISTYASGTHTGVADIYAEPLSL
jgi:FkbM family methyltransferase